MCCFPIYSQEPGLIDPKPNPTEGCGFFPTEGCGFFPRFRPIDPLSEAQPPPSPAAPPPPPPGFAGRGAGPGFAEAAGEAPGPAAVGSPGDAPGDSTGRRLKLGSGAVGSGGVGVEWRKMRGGGFTSWAVGGGGRGGWEVTQDSQGHFL